MSNYEGMNGHGVVMKKDMKVLKQRLIDAHNREIAGLKPRHLKANGLKKASIRTTSFPILKEYDDFEYHIIGSIGLDLEKGEFRFDISEQNHAMDDADCSLTFQALMRFMRQLPDKGKTYGAKTYYWSEYDEDGYGNKVPGTHEYYGAWEPAKQFAW